MKYFFNILVITLLVYVMQKNVLATSPCPSPPVNEDDQIYIPQTPKIQMDIIPVKFQVNTIQSVAVSSSWIFGRRSNCATEGLIVEISPGMNAGILGIGYGYYAGIFGLSVQLAVVRTWNDDYSIYKKDQQFIGIKAGLFSQQNFEVGVFKNYNEDSENNFAFLLSWGWGWEY